MATSSLVGGVELSLATGHLSVHVGHLASSLPAAHLIVFSTQLGGWVLVPPGVRLSFAAAALQQ